MPSFHLLLPGKLEQNTGGYLYDRHIVDGLRQRGWRIGVHELDTTFPYPDSKALAHAAATLAGLPEHACVVIDGLALGAMPDVVELHATRLCLVGLVHHPLALETGLGPEIAERLHASERQALSSTRAVITTSVSTARTLLHYAVPLEKITTVAPGVTKPSPTTSDTADASLQGTSLQGTGERAPPSLGNPLKLLCVATLIPRKGHDVLIEALRELVDKPWVLTCVGSDQRDRAWAEELRLRIDGAGLASRVQITGEISAGELQECYRRADVFVLASHHEGYGMVFDEAIANGLPIVATAAGAIVDTVPENAGLLVPPDDPPALANALASLLDASDSLHELRDGACRASRNRRSWGRACTEFASALERIDPLPMASA